MPPILSQSPRRILPVACQVIMFLASRKSEIAMLTEASTRLSSYVASDHDRNFARSASGEQRSRFHLALFLNKTVSASRDDGTSESFINDYVVTMCLLDVANANRHDAPFTFLRPAKLIHQTTQHFVSILRNR